MKNKQQLFFIFILLLGNLFPVLAAHLSPSVQITARMNGNNEVPAVTTTAQGLGVFTMSIDKQSILVDVAVTDLSGPMTGIHIHDGVAGTTGPVVFDLTPFINGNRVQTTLTGLTAAQRAKFFDGSYYLNAHTSANPGGEIRAQLAHETDFRYTAYLKGSNEVPAVTTSALGWGSFNLSKAGHELEINVSTDGLSGPITGAHLHMAAAGATGGVVEDLSAFVVGGSIVNAVITNPAYISDLQAGNIYINIHTAANPGGEIRDQLSLQPALHFDASINAAQAGTTSTGFSLGTVNVNYDLNTITVHAIAEGLTGPIQSAHIHEGAPGSAGPVVYDLGPLLVGNEIIGQLPLIDIASLNKFLSGDYYINIHTAAFPNGEIRGQIYKLSREGYVYDFGANNVPVSTCTGSGVGMVTIDRNQSNAHYMMVVSDISDPITVAHFHNAPATGTGPVIFDLTPDFGNFNNKAAYGYWTDQSSTPFMQPATSVLFRNSEVYTNIHTAACPAGAIRGNIMRGSEIVIGGGGEAIPTMSQWGLMMLGLMMMILSVVAIKSTQKQETLALSRKQ